MGISPRVATAYRNPQGLWQFAALCFIALGTALTMRSGWYELQFTAPPTLSTALTRRLSRGDGAISGGVSTTAARVAVVLPFYVNDVSTVTTALRTWGDATGGGACSHPGSSSGGGVGNTALVFYSSGSDDSPPATGVLADVLAGLESLSIRSCFDEVRCVGPRLLG